MKRALIVAVAAASMLLGGAGIATANGHGAPFGPGGINEDHPAWYGLCNAYGNNSDQGKQNGAPFQALEDHFDEDGSGDLDDEERAALQAFCDSRTPGNSGNAPARGRG